MAAEMATKMAYSVVVEGAIAFPSTRVLAACTVTGKAPSGTYSEPAGSAT